MTTATTTDVRRRLALTVLGAAVVVAVVAAMAVAVGVVRGRPVHVARDGDDGTWEVTVRSHLGEFEVELEPDDLSVLGIDYD